MIDRIRCLPVVVVLGAACRPAPTASPDAPVPAEPPAVELEPPSDRKPGDPLDATVPLLDGGTTTLADLRGRVVVLVLAATGVPSFAPVRAQLRRLDERHGDALTIVLVATDPTTDAIPRSVTDARGDVVLGWDPQGALATRLQARTLPLRFVLDVQGRVAEVRAGADAQADAAIASATDRLLAVSDDRSP